MSTEKILHDNGVINVLGNNSYEYQFFIKDHLGNTRVVCKPDFNSNGTLKDKPTVLQRSDYYPFGMLHGGREAQPTAENENRYLYNGKEYQARKWDNYGYTFYSSLHWYDYGARFYDAQLGRWHSVDPLAEKYSSLSPYDYVGGNPIIRIDPDGMDWYQDEDGQLVWSPDTYNSETGEGTQSIQLASKTKTLEDGTVEVLETKTYTWVAANGHKFGEEGANAVMTGGTDARWERDVVNTAEAMNGTSVITLGDGVDALENVTKGFGQVNDVVMRDHSSGQNGGVAGIMDYSDLDDLQGKMSSGDIKFNQDTQFFILSCEGGGFAKDIADRIGFTSYGANGGVGPNFYGSDGVYSTGQRSYETFWTKYSRDRMWWSNGKPVVLPGTNTTKLAKKISVVR